MLATCVGSALFARFNGGENGTLWYYDSLANVFLLLGPKKLAEELDRTVEEMYRQSSEKDPPRLCHGIFVGDRSVWLDS